MTMLCECLETVFRYCGGNATFSESMRKSTNIQ